MSSILFHSDELTEQAKDKAEQIIPMLREAVVEIARGLRCVKTIALSPSQ